jgi:hypothetical protein
VEKVVQHRFGKTDALLFYFFLNPRILQRNASRMGHANTNESEMNGWIGGTDRRL